jgi:hypothetical protein
MKKYQVTFYADRNDEELELEITGTISPFVGAIVHLPPERCSDSEGGNVEIHSILYRGDLWRGELSPAEREAVEELFFDVFGEDDSDEGPEWDERDDTLDRSYDKDFFRRPNE